MTSYVALLRGINLGSTNKVGMKDLRNVFEDLGHTDVRTYLQSGNVVFASPSPDSAELAREMEDAIARAFGHSIAVILRNNREMSRVARSNPFARPGAPPTSLHVMFLGARPSARAIATLDPGRSPPDEWRVVNREIYLWFPRGSGRSKLTVDYFERRLATRATARNWNTVTKVAELMRSS